MVNGSAFVNVAWFEVVLLDLSRYAIDNAVNVPASSGI
jgi:hypothetical protein